MKSIQSSAALAMTLLLAAQPGFGGVNLTVPRDPELGKKFESAVRAEQAEGNFDGAVRDLRRWVELYPNDPGIRANLYVAMSAAAGKAGDSEHASEYMSIARAIDPALPGQLAKERSGEVSRGGGADKAMAIFGAALQTMAVIQQTRNDYKTMHPPVQPPAANPGVQYPPAPVGAPGYPAPTAPYQPTPGYDPNTAAAYPPADPAPPQAYPPAQVQPQYPPAQQYAPAPAPGYPPAQPAYPPAQQAQAYPPAQAAQGYPPAQAQQQYPPQAPQAQSPSGYPQAQQQAAYPSQGQGREYRQQQYGGQPGQPGGQAPWQQGYRQSQYAPPYQAPRQYMRRATRGESFQPIRVVHDRSRAGDSAYFEKACGALLDIDGSSLTYTSACGDSPLIIPASEISEIRMNSVVGKEIGAFHIATRKGLYLNLTLESGSREESRIVVETLRKGLALGEEQN